MMSGEVLEYSSGKPLIRREWGDAVPPHHAKTIRYEDERRLIPATSRCTNGFMKRALIRVLVNTWSLGSIILMAYIWVTSCLGANSALQETLRMFRTLATRVESSTTFLVRPYYKVINDERLQSRCRENYSWWCCFSRNTEKKKTSHQILAWLCRSLHPDGGKHRAFCQLAQRYHAENY
jgi:hypothetical protein